MFSSVMGLAAHLRQGTPRRQPRPLTVRGQGLTFGITQPQGLRTLYLLASQGLHKGRNRLLSGQHGILV
jgi:hypothetical protein